MSLPHSSAAALNMQLAILDALPAHFAVLDRHGVVVAVNEAWRQFARTNGLAETDHGVGQHYLEVCDRASHSCAEAAQAAAGLRAVLSGASPAFTLDYPCHSSSEHRWFRMRAAPVHDLTLEGAVVAHIDITERMLAEEALRASEDRYRDLVEHSGDLICTHDLRGRLLSVNPAAERLTGYPLDVLLGMNMADLVAPAHRDAFGAYLAEIEATGAARGVLQVRTASGDIRYWEYANTLRSEGVNAPWVRGMAHDVTDRLRAEHASRASEQRFHAVAKATTDAIWDWDVKTDQVWWSDGLHPLFGGPPEEIEPGVEWWTSRIHPEDRARVLNSVSAVLDGGGENWASEYRFRRQDGSFAIVADRGFVIRAQDGAALRMTGGMTDVTAARTFERRTVHVQRLESIATLAGGIAHNLNNVLTPITLALDLLGEEASDPATKALLAPAAASARRGAALVAQVLSFAQGAEGHRVELGAGPLVEQVERLVRETFPKSIQVRTAVSPGLPPVLGDPTQIHQVLLNLCVNARDAMPDGGQITLAADAVELDEDFAAMNVDVRAGPFVVMRVQDTGVGVPSAIIDRIFEPFFTTKEVGAGTGLALSTSLAIIKSHGGFMRCHSEAGKGARFDVYLPAAAAAPAPQASVETPSRPQGQGETVLIVDDEAAIRQVTQLMLEKYGYRTLLAADGAEAVGLYSKHQASIAVVLVDMMMPVMDGEATIQVLLKVNPAVRTIAVSGIAEQHARATAAGASHFLSKPLTASALLEALRQAQIG